MRVNISCLLAFLLGCNVTAEIIHEVVDEKNAVTLRCPHPVKGNVTWSRETNGHKVNILTVGGDRDIRHNDPGRRYSSQADKSLHIRRVTASDSGRYLCNNEPAADLTVIPSGTLRLHAAERTSLTLTCPHDVGGSDVPTWSRDAGDIRQSEWFIVSPVDKTLTIIDVQRGDSGLYYCDGKPAAYLNVTKDETSDGGSKTTTTNTALTPEKETDQQTPPGLVIGIAASFLLLLLLVIIICVSWRRRRKRQIGFSGNEDTYHVYSEIQDGSVIQLTNGLQSFPGTTATFCMTDFPDGSNLDDPTYSTIPDLKPAEHKRDTSPNTACQYSLINNTFPGGNNKGSSQPTGNVYFLLEKAKTPANSSNQHI